MYSDSDLEAAVTAGALSPEAAKAFRNHVSARRATPVVDEEHFRLLTGFNDIFVAIAAVILLVAVSWIGDSIRLGGDWSGPSPLSGLFVAATAWGLAEFFTLKRRMALPSIILLLAFVGGLFGVTLAIIASIVGDTEALSDILLGFALLLGVGVFLFAMWWDSSDPRRETRRSDVAFWLHLLSAPLIVHSVFSLLGLTDGSATPLEAVIVLLVYVALGLTALAIDRRALLVSALAYVLWALSDLFERFGAVELSFALTAFVIGSALLLLSAFWHNARRAVVTPLPANLRSKLPVVERTVAV